MPGCTWQRRHCSSNVHFLVPHQPLAVAGWCDTALELEPWIPVDVVHFVGQALSPNSALHRKGLCLSALAVHSRFVRQFEAAITDGLAAGCSQQQQTARTKGTHKVTY